MELTGAQALVKSLEMQEVEVIFGLPGGAILPVYDPIIDSSIRHILVRHEQGAGHMAEGYAQATGRPGVAMVTSGPGATNIVTPLADAYMDSIPFVVHHRPGCNERNRDRRLPGVRHDRHHAGRDEAQLARHRRRRHPQGRSRSVPRRHDRPAGSGADRLPEGRLERDDGAGTGPTASTSLDTARPRLPIRRRSRQLCELLLAAERPVVYAGGGILKSRASDALREFVELTGIPVVTTLMARGAFPDSHPLCLGMPGMHGNYTAVTAMQRADLLLAFGSRFDDRVTGKVSSFAPVAKVIHVDIDQAEIGKVRRPEVGIVADCRLAIEAMISQIRGDRAGRPREAGALDRDPREVAGGVPVYLRPFGAGAHRDRVRRDRAATDAQARVRHRAVASLDPSRHDPRVRCRPASDVGLSVLGLRVPEHLDQLRRARDDGLRGSGRDRSQSR